MAKTSTLRTNGELEKDRNRPQRKNRPDVRCGSNWEVRAFNREVGFTPNSGRGLTLRKLTLCAKIGPWLI